MTSRASGGTSLGDGPLAPRLRELAEAGAAVTLHGYQPATTVARFVREQADLGVISLNRGVIDAAYPSKTMTYLRNGCPLLALVEPDSELARMVYAEEIGLTRAQEDASGLARRLRLLCDDRETLTRARSRAAETYRDRFSMPGQLKRWRVLIEEVAER